MLLQPVSNECNYAALALISFESSVDSSTLFKLYCGKVHHLSTFECNSMTAVKFGFSLFSFCLQFCFC